MTKDNMQQVPPSSVLANERVGAVQWIALDTIALVYQKHCY
jgi:hypothetical protein